MEFETLNLDAVPMTGRAIPRKNKVGETTAEPLRHRTASANGRPAVGSKTNRFLLDLNLMALSAASLLAGYVLVVASYAVARGSDPELLIKGSLHLALLASTIAGGAALQFKHIKGNRGETCLSGRLVGELAAMAASFAAGFGGMGLALYIL